MTWRARAQLTTLVAYGLIAAGCHGWLLAWAQRLMEFALAASLLGLTGRGRPHACCRWLALGSGFFVVAYGAPLAGSVGLTFGLLLTEPRAGAVAPAPLLRGVLALLVTSLILSTRPGHFALETISAGLSDVASALRGEPVSLGPTYSGARALLVAMPLAWLNCGCRARARALFLLAGAAVAGATTVAAGAVALPPFGSRAPGPARWLAAQLPWAPVLLTLLIVLLGAKQIVTNAGRRVVLALACIAVSVVVIDWPAAGPRRPGRVLLYEKGYQNWAQPDQEHLGKFGAGMLGTLPDFLRAIGQSPRLVAALRTQDLEHSDTLVIINQDRPLPQLELEAVESFVESGGRLIVVADHTFLHDDGTGEPRIWANQVLRHTAIRFQNNSADPVCLAFFDATVASGLGSPRCASYENPCGSSIGCGLQVDWPAQPLVVGRYGYNDQGVDRDPRDSYLGDLLWSPGERLGDVVLAATARQGAGRVFVIGDTTGITNLGRAFRWDWWARLFSGHLEPDPARHGVILAALVLAALLTSLGAPAGVAAACLALCAACAIQRGHAADELARADVPIGIVDLAPMPAGRRGGWGEDGLLSLVVNLSRAGHVPLVADTRTSGVLGSASVVVVTRPRNDPGADWAAKLCEWVRGGGKLLVGASHGDSAALEELLTRLDARVRPHVVGPVRLKIPFGDSSLRLSVREPWVLDLRSDAWRPAIAIQGRTIAAWRPLGAGIVWVVGDSTFLTNASLESSQRVERDNVRFLQALLKDPVARR